MKYNSLKEIHSFLHSPEIANCDLLEYRVLLIEICYQINQHMVQGQSLTVTRVLAQEYTRLAAVYQEITNNFDRLSVAQVKATALVAIDTVQKVLDQKRPGYVYQMSPQAATAVGK